MLLVACFNNSYKDHVFFYIFFCIICVKSRPGITSSRFYYIVEQKYIFVKLIGAWIFLANIPFLLHCLLFLQYKFPHFPTITQTGTFSFSLWRFELLEVKCTSLLRNDHHSPILSFNNNDKTASYHHIINLYRNMHKLEKMHVQGKFTFLSGHLQALMWLQISVHNNHAHSHY